MANPHQQGHTFGAAPPGHSNFLPGDLSHAPPKGVSPPRVRRMVYRRRKACIPRHMRNHDSSHGGVKRIAKSTTLSRPRWVTVVLLLCLAGSPGCGLVDERLD